MGAMLRPQPRTANQRATSARLVTRLRARRPLEAARAVLLEQRRAQKPARRPHRQSSMSSPTNKSSG